MNQYLKDGKKVRVQKIDDMSELFYVTIFTSKDHPLLEVLQLNVMRLVEGGLVGFWLNEFAKGERGNEDNAQPFPLSFVHLKGIFEVAAGLLIVSGLMFFCEIIYWRNEICIKGAWLILDK